MYLVIELADSDTHWPGKPDRSLADELDLLKSSYDSPDTHFSSAGTYVQVSGPGPMSAHAWSFVWRVVGLEVTE